MRHSPHFNRIPKLMTIHAILNIEKMLNYFPTKGRIAIDMIPRAILNGKNLNYNKHLKLQFGQHVPEIERRIRVFKERSRAMRRSLPFNSIPKLMTTHAILNIGKMFN